MHVVERVTLYYQKYISIKCTRLYILMNAHICRLHIDSNTARILPAILHES